MAKTAEEFLKTLIGDLVITNAQLAAQIEALREQIPKPEPDKTHAPL
jgi:hypothetical protein